MQQFLLMLMAIACLSGFEAMLLPFLPAEAEPAAGGYFGLAFIFGLAFVLVWRSGFRFYHQSD